ncbi:MAG: class I tRNA ligase family protein, partial [Candidatus Micrarchaeota archaeon]|nr:class I tRNA ligase family protein [Candidatus Micrarchaeota archaeon]
VSPDDAKHKKLVGREITVPIFDIKVKVIADRRVDPAFGTGVVMCCTFGDQTDIEWYKAYNLDLRVIIDEKGRMNHPYYGGMKIKEAREKIVADLKERGVVLKEEEIEHSVNVHDRCGTEIEFVVKKQWYVRYLDLKDKFLEFGNRINWHPQYMKHRYDNWIKGLQWDWSISRQRFFGVYFPVWYCEKCGEPKFAEEKDLPVNPFSDRPKGKCANCGAAEFLPETDVMDTWATSSLTPLINARWGLDDRYVKKILPMSLRPQAHDIITFWAFNTIVKAYFHTGDIPWKDIIISGHALDPKGNPMHKSQGNVIYPQQYIEKYGADALRFWASASMLGEDSSFQEKEVVSGSRLINKLWNVARFIEMKCLDVEAIESKSAFDHWILGLLDDTSERTAKYFDEYNYFNARTTTEGLFWVFANDYLEFVKERIYGGDKSAAYTLNIVFLGILKMLSPFIPFVTEELYQEIFLKNPKLKSLDGGAARSIHLSNWPKKVGFDAKRSEAGSIAAEATVGIRKLKHDSGVALNQEISAATLNGAYEKNLSGHLDEIKQAMKVKEISFEKHDGTEKVIS